MTTSYRVIFAGTPAFAAVALDALIQSEHDVVAVYTQPDRPAGRGRKIQYSAVKQCALAANLAVFQPASLLSVDTQAQFKAWQADVMIVAAYGLILPEMLLAVPRLGCLNIHASLLPKWRGAAPIQRAILANDPMTGITIMQMDQGLDTGAMLLKRPCKIAEHDTAQTLHDKLALLGAEAIMASLDDLAKWQTTATVQDDSLSTYAKKLLKTEATIDWMQPAKAIALQIRAMNPWPVAQTLYHDKQLRFWSAVVLADDNHIPLTDLEKSPGTVIAASQRGVDIITGQGVLRGLQLQLPGGKAMEASALVNAHAMVGVSLGA